MPRILDEITQDRVEISATEMKKMSYPGLRSIFFLVAAWCMYSRAPQLLADPRFWAEEGSRYFRYATENGFWTTLFFLDPRAGYLDVTRHFSAGLASLVPLGYAPYVTTGIAFLLQLMPCWILIFGNSKVFDDYWKRAGACVIILFAPSLIDEVWVNTINSMTWYGLIAFLILTEDLTLAPRWRSNFYRSLLAVGALSGPYVCMLLPAYGLVAFRERTRATVANVGILGMAIIIHSLVLIYFFYSGELNEKRFGAFNLTEVLYAVFWDHVATPIIGREAIQHLTGLPFGLSVFLLVSTALAVSAGIYVYRLRIQFWCNNWLIGVSWLCFSAGTAVSSFNHHTLGRYGVLPGWLLLFFLLNLSRNPNTKSIRFLAAGVLTVALAVGLSNFRLEGRTECDGDSWAHDISVGGGEGILDIPICPEGWRVKIPEQQ